MPSVADRLASDDHSVLLSSLWWDDHIIEPMVEKGLVAALETDPAARASAGSLAWFLACEEDHGRQGYTYDGACGVEVGAEG